MHSSHGSWQSPHERCAKGQEREVINDSKVDMDQAFFLEGEGHGRGQDMLLSFFMTPYSLEYRATEIMPC